MNLSKIAEEYKNIYNKKYGQGYFGFFTLPLKRFFQQSTRSAEIKFMESVEEICQKNHELSDDEKNSLKISAVNLVLLKIGSESFGEKSLLKEILNNRKSDSGQNNNKIMLKFIEHCEKLKIEVPQHLINFSHEKDFDHLNHQFKK